MFRKSLYHFDDLLVFPRVIKPEVDKDTILEFNIDALITPYGIVPILDRSDFSMIKILNEPSSINFDNLVDYEHTSVLITPMNELYYLKVNNNKKMKVFVLCVPFGKNFKGIINKYDKSITKSVLLFGSSTPEIFLERFNKIADVHDWYFKFKYKHLKEIMLSKGINKNINEAEFLLRARDLT